MSKEVEHTANGTLAAMFKSISKVRWDLLINLKSTVRELSLKIGSIELN